MQLSRLIASAASMAAMILPLPVAPDRYTYTVVIIAPVYSHQVTSTNISTVSLGRPPLFVLF